MANSEDVELFLEGVQAWNEGMKKRNEQWDTDANRRYIADLSDTEIGPRLFLPAIKEEDFPLRESTHYPRAELGSCDLRNANFGGLFSRDLTFEGHLSTSPTCRTRTLLLLTLQGHDFSERT